LESLITATRKMIMRGGVERRAIRTIDLAEARAERAKCYEQGGTMADLESLIAQGKRFSVIYVDFPWRYDDYSGGDRSSDKHYETMNFEELKAFMPLIAKLAADDCMLFLWVPGTHALYAQELLAIAGFKFKRNNAFTWVKLLHPDTDPKEARLHAEGYCTGNEELHFGLGQWSRGQTEACWLATKGAPKRLEMDVREVVFAPVGRHSEKPDEVRRRIARLAAGPRLELFARKCAPDWVTWGNEIVPESAVPKGPRHWQATSRASSSRYPASPVTSAPQRSRRAQRDRHGDKFVAQRQTRKPPPTSGMRPLAAFAGILVTDQSRRCRIRAP
jgi:N6-adenosine-specific RNA methylase IME4